MLYSLTSNNVTLPARRKVIPLMTKLPNILLIDDDDIFVFLTKKMLISTGLVNTISVCRSASEAVQFLKNTNDDKSIPDMIFLDLNMPGMNGWEFLECYQAILPKMNTAPLLYVVSSSIADDDYERAMNIHGVNGYMSKPLQPLQLKTLMHSIYL